MLIRRRGIRRALIYSSFQLRRHSESFQRAIRARSELSDSNQTLSYRRSLNYSVLSNLPSCVWFPQVPQPVTQTTVTLVTTVVNHGFVAAPLVTTQTLKRFRRDVLEGTQEELMMETGMTEGRDNNTLNERDRRQAEFPGNPEEDNTKSVIRDDI